MTKLTHRLSALLLALMLVVGLAVMANAASYTYNADAALKYAKDNVNTSKEKCAGFVSKCLQEGGGLNVKYSAGTGPLIRNICTAIGIPYNTGGNIDANMVALVATLPTLTLDSNGFPTTANKNILQAGDVVFQWCSTCPISPHMMICNGYSGSNAVFYWTNSVGNNKTYDFKSHKDHSGHTLVGKVLQIRPQNKQYTVTLNANGFGYFYDYSTTPTTAVLTTAITVTNGSTYGTLPTPERVPGYTFDGWYTAASGGTKVTSSTTVNLTANQTLYAHWNVGSSTLTLNPNGGTVTPTSVTQAIGSTYILPTPTRSGYTFNGWTLSGYGTLNGNTFTFGTYNGMVTAQWAETATSTYTLTINANGGTVTPTSVTQAQGTIYILPTPTRSGYTFTGWTLSGGGTLTGNKYTFGTSNGTVTAQWQWAANVTNYTLTYNANGGTGAPAAQTMPANTDFNLSRTIPVRTGYTFLCWSTAAGKEFSPGESVYLSGDITLYAVWEQAPDNTTSSTGFLAIIINLILFFFGFGWLWM